jgi:hypothetical protein
VIVAAVGRTILTTAGMLSGWITSIVSVSALLMGPADKALKRRPVSPEHQTLHVCLARRL